MIATVQRRTGLTTYVTIVSPDTDDDKVTDAALAVAGETRTSIFGRQITRHDNGTATVALHTD